MREKDRRDTCKCGRIFYWSTNERIVICPRCKTEYRIEADSVLVHWLEEMIEHRQPYRTEAR